MGSAYEGGVRHGLLASDPPSPASWPPVVGRPALPLFINEIVTRTDEAVT